MIHSDISRAIGRTPLIKLNRLSAELGINIIAKTESRNPAGSVKDRVGYALIDDAEKNGTLSKSMTILEPTSGNTGIALAAIGRAKGYNVKILMPESMSVERRKIIAGLGAELVLTPASGGMALAVETAKKTVADNPGKYFMPDQFSNPANPAIHVLTTGPEIELDADGKVDAVVAGVGTGGTVSGIGTYFKRIRQMKTLIIGIEPASSAVITQKLEGIPLSPSPHKIQGIGAGFIPEILDLSVVDKIITVEDDDAISMAARIMEEEGVLCGISGGAAVAGAVKAFNNGRFNAEQPENFNVVVIIPDSGERYLSTALYEHIK